MRATRFCRPPRSKNRSSIPYTSTIRETRLSTFLNLKTHVAAQRILDRPPATEPPIIAWLRRVGVHSSDPDLQVKDLGPGVIEGLDVHGYLQTVNVPAKASGTGLAVAVTDEYWYSEELRINIFTRHSDPRTGQLAISVSQINPNEPDVDLFKIPPDYKLVDMTPPDMEDPNAVQVEP